ncbi:MAG: hypothetical protein ABI273_11505 [Lacunisphaera sp.]
MSNPARAKSSRKAAEPVVNTYVASQAAIAAHCFDNDPTRIPDISSNWTNGNWYIAAAQIIRLRSVFAATPNVYAYYPGSIFLNPDIPDAPVTMPYMANAAGADKWVNYFNISDWALDGWITDQALKPDSGYSYLPAWTYPGSSNPCGRFAFGDGDPVDGGLLLDAAKDTYDIFSYAAQARSQPLGRQPSVMGVFNGQQTDWSKYGDKHPGHSAEFRSFLAQRSDYWNRLLVDFSLKAPQ